MSRLHTRSYRQKSCDLMIFPSFFALLTGFPNNIHGQSNDPSMRIYTTLAQQLQTVLDDALISRNLMGISAAVFIPGQEIWLGVSGISDPAASDSIRSEMLFSIGSTNCTPDVVNEKACAVAEPCVLYEGGTCKMYHIGLGCSTPLCLTQEDL